MVRNFLRNILLFFISGLLLSGCTLPESDQYRTMESFQNRFQKRDFSHLTGVRILTLEDARKTALLNNPDYLSAYYAVNSAKYRYYSSLGAYLPKLNVTANVGQMIENGSRLHNPPEGVERYENNFTGGAGIHASYLIFDGFAREFAALIARYDYRKNLAEDENARRLLIRAVSYAYYDVILAREAERIARADLSFQESSLVQAENRYRSGYVSKAAVLNFKILANYARSAISNAVYRGAVARHALAALMGYVSEALPDDMELSPLELNSDVTFSDLGLYLQMAVANRPDLRVAGFLFDIARNRHYAAYSGFFPEFHGYLGYGFLSGNSRYRDYRVKDSFYNRMTFHYGVSGEWNIFNGFSTWNLVRERHSDELFALLQMDNTFLKVINEVKDAYSNCSNAREQVKLYREMMEWVFEQRQLIQAEYWGGMETITRLNGAQSDLITAESRLAIAAVELKKAIVQLNAAVNLPPENDLRRTPDIFSVEILNHLLDILEKKYQGGTECFFE